MGTKTKTTKKLIAKQQPVPFWRRHARAWKWLGGVLAGLVALVLVLLVWVRVNPWPGTMIVRYVFDKGGAKTAAALEKHAPQNGVLQIKDQRYKPGDADAKLDVYMPASAEQQNQKLPAVIWTHGGAWVSGSKDDASAYYQLLAQAGYTVVAVNYSLAPEKKYPTPLHQLNAAYGYIQENADRFHVDTDSVFLAGDSAGSQLSAQMAAIITNPAYAAEIGIVPQLKPEQLQGVVLNCGIYKMKELALPGADVAKILNWGDRQVVWAYSGTKNFEDPIIRQMSPYYHVTKDFPPVFITGGNADPLTDVQSKPFAEKLQSLGVPVTTLFYAADHEPELPHEYQFNLDNADGQNALAQILTFLSSRARP